MQSLVFSVFLAVTCLAQAQEERRIYVDKHNLSMKHGEIVVRFSQGKVTVKQLGVDSEGYYVYPAEFMVHKSEGA